MKRTYTGRTTSTTAMLGFFLGRIALADPKAAGPSWSAPEVLTGEHLALEGGKLAVPVSPVRMRMVEVQADAGAPQ